MTTYTKLKSGEWRIRSTTEIQAGQTVSVQTKAGKTKSETVAKVIWSGNGVWLASIKPKPNRRYEYPDCGEIVQPGTQCWETGLTH